MQRTCRHHTSLCSFRSVYACRLVSFTGSSRGGSAAGAGSGPSSVLSFSQCGRTRFLSSFVSPSQAEGPLTAPRRRGVPRRRKSWKPGTAAADSIESWRQVERQRRQDTQQSLFDERSELILTFNVRHAFSTFLDTTCISPHIILQTF
jgi:hypothetical protein